MNFKSSGSLGDIIYAVPCILAHGGGNLYLEPGSPANYYDGCISPHGSTRMSLEAARWLLPLLNFQPLIRSEIWQHDRQIDVNLDEFRWTGISHLWGHIAIEYAYAHPFYWDFSKPYLSCPPLAPGKYICCNVTSRYRNGLDYTILRDYPVVFVGLEDEFAEFAKIVPEARYMPTVSALRMASIIAGAVMFVGNQSCAFAIAEGLVKWRVLELCPWAANVIPMIKGYSCLNQLGFAWSIKDCYERATASTYS